MVQTVTAEGHPEPAVAEEAEATAPEVTKIPGPAHHVDQSRLYSYRPALDGIRGLALIGVVIYHSAQLTTDPINVLPGGFLGVDLFFVLSGYLITTLLLNEFRSRDTIRLGTFWLRRARRLFPALILVVALVSLAYLFGAAFLHLDGSQLGRFRRDGLASIFYSANWSAAFSGLSYFDKFGGASPFRHMWSLAIEEQFYLFWPVVLYVTLKVMKVRFHIMAMVAFAGACASAILMAVLFQPGQDPSRIYYGTDTRAQAMLLGAFGAFVLLDLPREKLGHRYAQIMGWVGLVGTIFLWWWASDDVSLSPWIYTGGFFGVSIVAIMAIATASGPQDTVYTKMLSWGPLVWIGTLSYGLYLWHWPVFVFVDSDRTGLGGIWLLTLRLAIVVALSTASYFLIEAPIRFGGLQNLHSRRLALVGGLVCFVAISVALIFVQPSEGDQTLAAAEAGAAAINVPTSHPGDIKALLVGDSSALSFAVRRPSPKAPDGFSFMTDAQLGCSISNDLTVPGKSSEGTSPLCHSEVERWKNDIAQFSPDVTIMLFGPWEIYDRVSKTGQTLKVGSPEFNNTKLDELNTAFKVLNAKGAPLVVMTTPCLHAANAATAASNPEINDAWRVDNYNTVLRQFADQHPGEVFIADLHGLLCPDGVYTGTLNGIPYTEDSLHFNVEGTPQIWKWLEPQLERFRPKK